MTASNTSTSNQHTTYAASITRYWREKETPTPFLPTGVFFLLGLSLLFIAGLAIVAPTMQQQTQKNVTAALINNNFNDLKVSTDGQQVLIEGASNEKDKAIITAITSATHCNTWAGDHKCPTTVHVQLRNDTKNTEHIAQQATPQPPKNSTPTLTAPPHAFTWRKNSDGIFLSGEIPTIEVHDEIIEKSNLLASKVYDQTTITNRQVEPHFNQAIEQAFNLLKTAQSGSAYWSKSKLSFKGSVTKDKESTLKKLFFNPQIAALQGEFKLQIMELVDRCNEEFKNTLQNSTIQFQTSSAAISSSSKKTLSTLAELAKTCPIDLQIEGHTDNTGDELFNKGLSHARAQAVIAALQELEVDTQRLIAKGFGSAHPKASNSTSAGRAENRRIEIKSADL